MDDVEELKSMGMNWKDQEMIKKKTKKIVQVIVKGEMIHHVLKEIIIITLITVIGVIVVMTAILMKITQKQETRPATSHKEKIKIKSKAKEKRKTKEKDMTWINI